MIYLDRAQSSVFSHKRLDGELNNRQRDYEIVICAEALFKIFCLFWDPPFIARRISYCSALL